MMATLLMVSSRGVVVVAGELWKNIPGKQGKVLLACANPVVSEETRQGLQPSGTMAMLGRQRQPRRATTR
jgi:hypothetical protein